MFKISTGVLLSVIFACGSAFGDDSDKEPIAKNKLPDTIYLKSGGELKGEIVREFKGEENGRLYLLFRTESGGLLKLDQARLIKRQKKADEVDEEYQRRLGIAGDDPDLLWKVYQWCQDQESGTVRFKGELKFLLQRIMDLDANDDRARRLLGYDLVDGRWVREEQLYANHGYLKRGTSWAPELIQGVEADAEYRNQQEGLRKRELDKWLRAIKSQRGLSRNEIAQGLFSFCDEFAVPIIMEKAARDEKDRAMKLLYVEAFGRVPSYAANQALCHFAIVDTEPDVRERALTLLQQDHYDHSASVRLIAPALTAKANEYVRRAAFALGEIGSTDAIFPLIGGLETKHKITLRGNEPGRMSMSFGPGGTGLKTGGGPQSKTVIAKNDESLTALRKITEQDYGFDEAAWKNWYLENYTLYNVNVRADD